MARVARALGTHSTVFGLVSGYTGRSIAHMATLEGIDGLWVWTDGESSTCSSVLDHETGRVSELVERGVPVPDGAWIELGDKLHGALLACDALVIAGSLPPGSPPGVVLDWVRAANAGWVAVVLDVGSEAILLEVMPEHPTLVRLTASDAAAFTGMPDPAEAAEALRAAGARSAVVVAPAKGAFLSTESGLWRAAPIVESGPFSTGSSDAFMAGYLARHLAGAGPEASLAAAVAAGAANTFVPGPGKIYLPAFERLAPTVKLERLG